MSGRALVIGGGIGGLAAAIGLRREGWDVEVYERADELRAAGAGVALWANALEVLDRIGVGDRVRATGVPNADGWVYDWRGERLLPVATPALRARFGELGFVLHRAELQEILLDALEPGVVRLGTEVQDVEEDGDEVVATFADGRTARGDVLIGADGVHSAVRTSLFGPRQLRYAGYTVWRAVVPFEADRLLPGETWGRGARFGRAPLGGDRAYVFATQNAEPGGRSADAKAELRRLFGDWHDPIPELIEAMREEDILRHDISDLPLLDEWGRGRITLLGDAAHAMTPNLGQGACQALEDAVVLARWMGDGGAVEPALRGYEAERKPRVAEFVRRSWQVGRVGQWSHPVAVKLRAGLARHVLGRMQPRQIEWFMDVDF